MNSSIGFIGAGRITYILLERLRRLEALPSQVIVSDPDTQVVEDLKNKVPGIDVLVSNNSLAASQDIVFIGVHPPFMTKVLEEIKAFIKPATLLISLVPKFSIDFISQCLGGFDRIVRMIPNAPSLVGSGFNPTVFSPSIGPEEKRALISLFSKWGKFPEVVESKLESYVILTAVGPTYFWFQWIELIGLMQTFGLPQEDIENALPEMIHGSLDTLLHSNISFAEVKNLVKIKPLGTSEDEICRLYRESLGGLHEKLSTPIQLLL